MKVENSIEIDRPVADVWEFFAINHVRNHPRWDPTIQLEQEGDEPVGVGTVVKRTVSRFGRVTEGWMRCVTFEPEVAMAFEIHDGPMEMLGGADLETLGPTRTRLTAWADVLNADETVAGKIREMMRESHTNIKGLIEAGYPSADQA